MTEAPLGVLDASAYLRATRGEREAVEVIRALSYGRLRLHVPAYFYIEVANALRTLVVHRAADPNEARLWLNGAFGLRVEVDGDISLAGEALEFAFDHGITAYDAGYAVLALRREATLITADAGLAQAAGAAGVPVTLILDEAP